MKHYASIGTHLQPFWPFFFAHAQNWNYFYFLSEIYCYSRSHLHRLSIKVLKLRRFDVLVDFWPYFTAHVQNGNFRASGYNSDNAAGFSDPDFL